MDRPSDLGQLKSGEWGQLQDLVDRFEQACLEAGPRADLINLADYLPPKGDPLRSVTLHELIKTDLEIRWRRGQTVPIERYVERFPELGTVRELPAALIFEEYCVRQRHGDKAELTVYRGRFPEQFEDVQRLAREQPVATLATPAHTSPTAVGPGKSSKPPSAPTQSAASVSSSLQPFGSGYKKVKRIGSGSFGEVYRAIAPGGIEVAIKIINRPVDHEEAQRELQSLEQVKLLRHPYLLQTQAFFLEEDRLYIVMELADGSLRERLKECRAEGKRGVPVVELIRYFKESAEALDFLHAQHRMHRDIKPENILILQRHAKVADFGLARMMESQRMVSATSSGTPAYMAPEVWRGKVSHNSDQYSLAATYAELRMDRTLVPSRGDMMEVMLAHLERKPDLDPLPQAEQDVLLKALAKNPEERYATCSEFVAALEAAVAPELGGSRLRAAMLSGHPVATGSATHTDMGTLRPGQVAATLGHGGQGTHTPAPWQTVGGQQAGPARGGGWAVKVLLGLLVFIVAGIGGWLYFSPTGGSIFGSRLERQVDGFVRDKQFAEAVESVQKADTDDSRKAKLLIKVADAWLKDADDLKSRGNHEKAYAEYRDIYDRFTENAAVAQRCRDALGQVIPTLANDLKFAERFGDALDLLDKPPGEQLAEKQQLLQEIRAAWLQKAEAEFAAEDFATAERMAQEIVGRFSGKEAEPAKQLRERAHLKAVSASVLAAINDRNFASARTALLGRGQDLPENARTGLDEEIKTAWRNQAAQDLKDERFDKASATAKDFLRAYAGDKQVMALRDQAEERKTVKTVEDLLGLRDFRGAVKALRAGAALIKDEKRAELLKTKLLREWLDHIKKLAETDKDRALSDLEAFRDLPDKDFRDDKEAEKLYVALRPSRPAGDGAIAKFVEDGDACLSEGDTKNDPKQFEVAAKQYSQALNGEGIKDAKALHMRALRGQARAHARMNHWDDVKKDLESLDQLGEKALDNRTKAYRLALPILAAHATDEKVPPKEKLTHLASLRAEEREYLGKWEQDRLKEVFGALVRSLDLQHKPPDEALPLIEQLLAFEPQHVPTLMSKAELLYQKGELQTSGEIVLAVENLLDSTQEKEKQELLALKALVALKIGQSPNSPEDIKKGAVKLLKQVLAPGRPRLPKLAQEYAAFARKNPTYRGPTITALKSVLDKLPEADKKAVAPVYQELAAEHCKDLLAKAVAELDKNETEASLKSLDDAMPFAPDAATKENIEGLKHFANALKDYENKDPERAAEKMAMVRVELFSGPLSKQRVRAMRVLYEGAEKFRVAVDPNNPFQKPFQPENAEKAHKWLVAARKLAPVKEMKILRELVLAAACVSKPDSATVRQAIVDMGADAAPNKLGAEAVPFLLVKARAEAEAAEPAVREAAVQCYVDILDLDVVKPQLKYAEPEFARSLHNEVLRPAIKLGDRLLQDKNGAKLKKTVAQLYASQGQLLAQSLSVKWEFDTPGIDPKQVTIESYDKAIDYDPLPQYYARRGLARAELRDSRQQLTAMKADADTARQKDPNLPAAYALLGFVHHVEAGSATDLQDMIKKYHAASDAFREGIKLCRGNNDPEGDLPILLTNRVDALIKLAHIEPTNKKAHLRDARGDALEAMNSKSKHRIPRKTYQALGNVLEDSAWLGEESEYYPEALKVFQRALGESDDPIRFRIALSRCQYKYVAFGGRDDAKLLPQAAKTLQAICQETLEPKDEAEARYWLANVYLLQRENAKAEAAFKRVRELTKHLEGGERWDRLATRDLAFFALDDAEKQPEKDRAARLQQARQLADTMRDFGPVYAANVPHVLARASELEGKLKETQDMYVKNILKDGKEADLRLYLGLLECFLKNREQLQPNLTEVLQGAEVAVGWSKRPAMNDRVLRATALATAAAAHVALAGNADDPKAERKHRSDAMTRYDEAIDLVHPYHPGYWRWRYAAAVQLRSLIQGGDAAQRKKDAAKAIRYLTQATQKASSESDKAEYHSLRLELQKESKR